MRRRSPHRDAHRQSSGQECARFRRLSRPSVGKGWKGSGGGALQKLAQSKFATFIQKAKGEGAGAAGDASASGAGDGNRRASKTSAAAAVMQAAAMSKLGSAEGAWGVCGQLIGCSPAAIADSAHCTGGIWGPINVDVVAHSFLLILFFHCINYYYYLVYV